MIRYRAAVVATAVLGLLVVSGCGPSAPTFVKVQGKITMDGQPIDGAVVTYIPVGGKGEQASGRTSSDGVYQLTTRNTGDGALAGDYNVVITKVDQSETKGNEAAVDPSNPQEAMKKVYGNFLQKNFSKKPPEMAPKGPKSRLPEKYGKPTDPILKARVPAPGGSYDFDLQSK